MEEQQAGEPELEDILFLEILIERDVGDSISYEEFRKEMGWDTQES